MNNAPQDPTDGEDTAPLWGSAAAGQEPEGPTYPLYTPPPQAYPPPPQGFPPAPGGFGPQYGAPSPTPYPYGAQAPGPYGAPGWGVDRFGRPLSDKTKVGAGLLQLLLPLLSVCGVGRLYAGHIGIGLTQLLGFYVSLCGLGWFGIGILIAGGIWLWTVIDGIIILSSDSQDAQGRLLR